MLTHRAPKLYKHKGWYSLVFYDPGRQARKWISLGTQSKEKATRLAAPRVRAYEDGTYNPFRDQWVEEQSIKGAYAAWEKAKKEEGRRPRTIGNTKFLVDKLAEHLPPGCPMDDITSEDIKWLVKQPDSPAGRESYKRTLSAFFNWAVEAELCEMNPVKRVKLPKTIKKVPYFLSREDAQDLMERAPNAETANLIMFAIGSGLRCGELGAVTHQDINVEQRTIYVRGEVAKGRADRFVPLSSWAREAYEAQRERHPKGRLWPYSNSWISHRGGGGR